MNQQEAQCGTTAHAFAREVCKGNPEAMQCCDLFFHYCHGIDDLIDTMEDGRPTMSKEQIIALFINAAGLYNCAYYKKHSDLLLGIVISVTNSWADSVLWEKSPMPHRRVIADVLRTCGNEFFFMVAMIEGGWSHVRSVSAKIRERDWLAHHDDEHMKSEGK